MSNTPNIFIASSREGLPVAEAVNIKLEYEARVKQWDNAFDLSSVTITSLIDRANETDFSVFVFHKDDEAIIRDNKYSVVRDNVLFELGIFIGVLGIEKCFILIPKSSENDFHMPTDLAGVTTSTYDDEIDDMVDAVATSCAKIKQIINKSLKAESTGSAVITENAESIIQKELAATQSEIWRMKHDLERSQEEKTKLSSAISTYFYTVAKPATEAEILKWEKGAEESYSENPKIGRHNIFYIDKDIIIPSLYGASSVSVIVAKGVTVHGLDMYSHNNVYFMDGFRKIR